MQLSKYLIPVQEHVSKDATVRSHVLMQQSGMIQKICSGLYNWLPFGLAVMRKVEDIVRQEMNNIGAIELLTPCIQPKGIWEESGRVDAYGKETLQISDRHNKIMLFAPSAEELVTLIGKFYIKSYTDLPKVLYQIQWKFRDEIRPRFGLIRAREFLMKDAYSFDIDESQAIKTYYKMYQAYLNIYSKLGLKNVVPAVAGNGLIGGTLSHEFQLLSDIGENTVYYEKEILSYISENLSEDFDIEKVRQYYSVLKEQHDVVKEERYTLQKSKGIELGHIFLFGNNYSKKLGASVTDKKGDRISFFMGSYGIGISRVVAAIIQNNSDDKGIILPINISPFEVVVINLSFDNADYCERAKKLYLFLKKLNISCLLDDLRKSPAKKIKDNDLLGIPLQVIVGKDFINTIQIKRRYNLQSKTINIRDAEFIIPDELNHIRNYYS